MNNETRFNELGEPLITEEDHELKGVFMEKEVMTLKEACEFLSFSRHTMYGLLKKGKIPSHKVATQWRFIRSELIAWLKTLKAPIQEYYPKKGKVE